MYIHIVYIFALVFVLNSLWFHFSMWLQENWKPRDPKDLIMLVLTTMNCIRRPRRSPSADYQTILSLDLVKSCANEEETFTTQSGVHCKLVRKPWCCLSEITTQTWLQVSRVGLESVDWWRLGRLWVAWLVVLRNLLWMGGVEGVFDGSTRTWTVIDWAHGPVCSKKIFVSFASRM